VGVSVWVCVCIGLVMRVCGGVVKCGWVCVCLGFVMCVCGGGGGVCNVWGGMYGFEYVRVCVCMGLSM
jgi:hypothetical protein